MGFFSNITNSLGISRSRGQTQQVKSGSHSQSAHNQGRTLKAHPPQIFMPRQGVASAPAQFTALSKRSAQTTKPNQSWTVLPPNSSMHVDGLTVTNNSGYAKMSAQPGSGWAVMSQYTANSWGQPSYQQMPYQHQASYTSGWQQQSYQPLGAYYSPAPQYQQPQYQQPQYQQPQYQKPQYQQQPQYYSPQQQQYQSHPQAMPPLTQRAPEPKPFMAPYPMSNMMPEPGKPGNSPLGLSEAQPKPMAPPPMLNLKPEPEKPGNSPSSLSETQQDACKTFKLSTPQDVSRKELNDRIANTLQLVEALHSVVTQTYENWLDDNGGKVNFGAIIRVVKSSGRSEDDIKDLNQGELMAIAMSHTKTALEKVQADAKALSQWC